MENHRELNFIFLFASTFHLKKVGSGMELGQQKNGFSTLQRLYNIHLNNPIVKCQFISKTLTKPPFFNANRVMRMLSRA